MHAHYPRFSQILRATLPALLLAHFVVWPIVGLLSPYAGIIAAECTLLWFVALYIRRHRLIAEDLLLFNATPATTLLLTIPVAICCSLIVAEFDLYLIQLLGLIGPIYAVVLAEEPAGDSDSPRLGGGS